MIVVALSCSSICIKPCGSADKRSVRGDTAVQAETFSKHLVLACRGTDEPGVPVLMA